MRGSRILAVIAVLALAIALPWVSGATHSNGNGPKKDQVFGTGDVISPSTMVRFQVHVNGQLKNGTPQGQVVSKASTGDFSGPIVCLIVPANPGNLADLTIVVDRTTDLTVPVGTSISYTFEDGGEPGAGQDKVRGTVNQANCQRQDGRFTVQQGNYIVHDGQI